MKNLHLVLVLFSIASMFTSFGVYDVDAIKDDNNGYGKGCENANDNSKVKEKNPHCNVTPSCDLTDLSADCDGDGLTNGEEAISCTEALMADTDIDGFNDGVELDAGTNPCDAGSFPQI